MMVDAARTTGAAKTLAERCAAIDLLLLDVDGVMTDGGILYNDDGVELKQFNTRDGAGLKLWAHVGKKSAILTGRSSQVVEVRAAEVGITHVIQGAAEKLSAYHRLLTDHGWKPEQVCYVGDDLPDVPVLLHCGLAAAVADGCPETRSVAHYVTQLPGGRGAVREVIELVLGCQGLWQRVVESFRNQGIG
jgi:3-deoxy-D-manno-octulosonate 8-phosphate phosphatase (KDO 8-P phosphatase)